MEKETAKFYYDASGAIINHPFYDAVEESDMDFIELSLDEWQEKLSAYSVTQKPYCIDGKIVFKDDENYLNSDDYMKSEILSKISEQQKYLSDTDYVVSKLNELKLEDEEEYETEKEKYADILLARKGARKQINELQAQLDELNNK